MVTKILIFTTLILFEYITLTQFDIDEKKGANTLYSIALVILLVGIIIDIYTRELSCILFKLPRDKKAYQDMPKYLGDALILLSSGVLFTIMNYTRNWCKGHPLELVVIIMLFLVYFFILIYNGYYLNDNSAKIVYLLMMGFAASAFSVEVDIRLRG